MDDPVILYLQLPRERQAIVPRPMEGVASGTLSLRGADPQGDPTLLFTPMVLSHLGRPGAEFDQQAAEWIYPKLAAIETALECTWGDIHRVFLANLELWSQEAESPRLMRQISGLGLHQGNVEIFALSQKKPAAGYQAFARLLPQIATLVHGIPPWVFHEELGPAPEPGAGAPEWQGHAGQALSLYEDFCEEEFPLCAQTLFERCLVAFSQDIAGRMAAEPRLGWEHFTVLLRVYYPSYQDRWHHVREALSPLLLPGTSRWKDIEELPLEVRGDLDLLLSGFFTGHLKRNDLWRLTMHLYRILSEEEEEA